MSKITGLHPQHLDFMRADSADFVCTVYEVARVLNLSAPSPDMPAAECSRAAWKRTCREFADKFEFAFGADFDRVGFLRFCTFLESEI